MTQTLSHTFIETLAGPRDRLYSLALACRGTPAAAEAALQQKTRELFSQVARGAVPDIPAALERAIMNGGPISSLPAPTETPMPADVWARLAAAIQLEAAHSSHSQALNPDSVLLRPDPLLVPKKTKPADTGEDFDVSSPSRVVFALGTILVLALLITVYILTRPAPQRPATQPAAPATRSQTPASNPARPPALQ